MKRNTPNDRRPMPAEQLHSDDSIDPLKIFGAGRRERNSHKTRQLCRQAERAISMTLGEMADEVLQSLSVQSVEPAPDASRLLVCVSASSLLMPSGANAGADPISANVADIYARLERVRGILRREVAAAITRKRAPELLFRVIAGPEAQP